MPRIGANSAELPVSATRRVNTLDGLLGGGDLTQDLDLEVRFGTAADSVARGTDARLSDARPWSLYDSTGSPTNQQPLVFNTTTGKWGPGTVSAGVDAEQVRDIVGATLVAGSNISVVVNDAGDSITINSTGSGSGTVADATTSLKGIIQLAGDLGGTAAVPTVPGAEKTVNKSTTSVRVANGYIGADASGNVGRGHLPTATSTLQGTIQLAGDLAGTAAGPTVPQLADLAANKVDKSTRGPVMGHIQIPFASVISPDASTGNSFYCSVPVPVSGGTTNTLTVTAPTGGVDGQRVAVEVFADGVSATVSLSGPRLMVGMNPSVVVSSTKIALVTMMYSSRLAMWVATGFNVVS